jgi:hypothetical protein
MEKHPLLRSLREVAHQQRDGLLAARAGCPHSSDLRKGAQHLLKPLQPACRHSRFSWLLTTACATCQQ